MKTKNLVEQRAEKAAYMREYSQRPHAHEKKTARDRTYYLRNRAARLAYHAKRREENPEYMKVWRKKNRAHLTRYSKGYNRVNRWRKTWWELMRKHRAVPGQFTEEQALVIIKAYPLCVYCGKAKASEFEHVYEPSNGGRNDFLNVVRACKPCNASKRSKFVRPTLPTHVDTAWMEF